jgi:hypothetical protein
MCGSTSCDYVSGADASVDSQYFGVLLQSGQVVWRLGPPWHHIGGYPTTEVGELSIGVKEGGNFRPPRKKKDDAMIGAILNGASAGGMPLRIARTIS